MRLLSIMTAATMAVALISVSPLEAKGRHGHYRTVQVQLANGRSVRAHLMMMNGRMMAVIPAQQIGLDSMGHPTY